MSDLLDEILIELKERRGVDFRAYRRGILESQLTARMTQMQCAEGQVYLGQLRQNPKECDALLDAFTINVSCFFRNPLVFELLAQRILPELLESKRAAGGRELRIWSAGCASGEEPYSVAILLRELLAPEQQEWMIHIFATDIDDGPLGLGRQGLYSEDRLEDAKLGFIQKYFRPQGDIFEILPEICDMVCFSRDDLTSAKLGAPTDSVFGGFDLILCRNVLIYLELDFQRKVCEKLSRALNGGGYLILGEAERLPQGMNSKLAIVDNANRIYRKNAGGRFLGRIGAPMGDDDE